MKKNRQDMKHRIGLALFLSAISFCVLLATALVEVVFFYFTEKFHIIAWWSMSRLGYLLGMAFLSLGVGTLLTFLGGSIPMKPVLKIIQALNSLAEGNYKTRLKFKGIFSKLPVSEDFCSSFNTLAKELDNTEVLRSDFINNFSHEFKTPIVSITGFAKLLKRGNLSEKEQKEYLDIIEQESMRLSRMATNVLQLTKIENQEILTDVKEFNLSEQLRNCILLLEDKWNKKNLDFNLEFSEYQISANENLLKEVWLNLLDNAIKYTPDWGTISVTIEEEKENLKISVENTGSTIPKDKIDKIFQKFYQCDESHSSQGNGVGLAIVKKVVDLHNGNITVSCKKDSTCFIIRLPQKSVPN